MKSKKKHLRSLLRIYILGIIIKNEKVHGYSIYKELLERIDESIYKKTGTPSIGTIYRILKELVEEGLVTKEERTKNGRKIIYYAPTKKGIEEFLSISKMFITKVIMGLSLVIDVVKTLDKKGYDIVDIFYDIKKINQITSNI
ncbi:MAG: PadR family transcriptional regulator [Thermoprotei archaeon]|nr:MAG: PadR family transcriptional regulator [Thermoprotei archaeon]